MSFGYVELRKETVQRTSRTSRHTTPETKKEKDRCRAVICLQEEYSEGRDMQKIVPKLIKEDTDQLSAEV